MRVYIASHIFKPDHIAVVEEIIQICDRGRWPYFSPYHASREIWKGRAPKDCSPEERKQVLEQNIAQITLCNIMVAWINRGDDGYEGRPDTGVVWEMGYASSTGIPIIAYLDPNTPIHRKGVNLMLTGTVDAVVESTTGVERALNLIEQGRFGDLEKQFDPQRKIMQEQDVTGGVHVLGSAKSSFDDRLTS